MIHLACITATVLTIAAAAIYHAHRRKLPDGSHAMSTPARTAVWLLSAAMLTVALAGPALAAEEETPPQLTALQQAAQDLQRQVRELDQLSRQRAQQPFHHDERAEQKRQLKEAVKDRNPTHHKITVYQGDEDTFLNILHADIERSGTVVATLSDDRLAAHMPQSYLPCIQHLGSIEYHNRSDGQYVPWVNQNAAANNSNSPAQPDDKTNLVVFQIHGEEYPIVIVRFVTAIITFVYAFTLVFIAGWAEEKRTRAISQATPQDPQPNHQQAQA